MSMTYDDPHEEVEDLGGGELTALTKLARRLELYDDEIIKAEARVTELKERRRHLAEVVLPEAMDKVDIEALPLRDGAKLEVQEIITAGISKERKAAAFSWLRAEGYGSLIKRKVSVEFGRGGDNEARALVDDLRKRGLRPEDKEDVHYQTLGAFVREQLAKGANLPMELLGVNRVRRARVVRPE